VHNLTAVRAPADLLTHHLLDCLAVVPELARLVPAGQLRLLDVGSGGGLPAIPLAIACPRAAVTALDAVEKKCAFMLQARAELGLAQFTVVHGRVEAYCAEPFNIITARAFSSLAQLVRLSEHLLHPDGLWVAMKGQIPLAELAALPDGVRRVATVKLRVPRLDQQRHLILLAPRPRPERCAQQKN
jgi:16S rRNA (guanine527-N7)-methyltransferase